MIDSYLDHVSASGNCRRGEREEVVGRRSKTPRLLMLRAESKREYVSDSDDLTLAALTKEDRIQNLSRAQLRQ